MQLVGVNYRQNILHMSRIMVHCYYTDETINQYAIGSVIKPSLNCNKVFRVQVEKCLSVSFHSRKMKTVRFSEKEEYTFYGTNNDL